MNTDINHLLAGCSFTDPLWQEAVPWSVFYGKKNPSYVVAKAGMGIKGICTETLYYLENLNNISTLIIVLPTLWRMDIEMDVETNMCNAMVDLLLVDGKLQTIKKTKRKWIVSGGLHYDKKTQQASVFDFLYKHQGFLVIAKEHFRSLKMLLNYCKERKIKYYISAIQDPMEQLVGLDYILQDIIQLLEDVEYHNWIRFDGKFIDKFLQHNKHPTTDEHQILCSYILNTVNQL